MPRSTRRFVKITGLAAIAVSLSGLAQATADQIHVPEDYPTIQQAIDAADHGYEIIVAPGTYNEMISFSGKAIHLRSAAGADKTIIDALDMGTVVTIVDVEKGESILEGFTIAGGDAFNGGGMYAFGSTITVNGCIFDGNKAGKGGAIFAERSSLNIVNSVFTENIAHFGGTLYHEESTVEITGSTITNGFSTHWAAAVLNIDSIVTIQNTEVSDNLSWQQDGVISNYTGSSLTVLNSTITNNSLPSLGHMGGGLFNSGELEVGGTFFCLNHPEDIFQHPTLGAWTDLGDNLFSPDSDLNCDGIVNVLDLLILLESWGECDDPNDCPADLNGDSEVNVLDLLILLENWGSQ